MKWKILYAVYLCLVGSILSPLYAENENIKAYKIVLQTLKTEQQAQNALTHFNEQFHDNEAFKKAIINSNFKPKARASGRYFILVLEPFYSRKNAVKVRKIILSDYPDAYIGHLSLKNRDINLKPLLSMTVAVLLTINMFQSANVNCI